MFRFGSLTVIGCMLAAEALTLPVPAEAQSNFRPQIVRPAPPRQTIPPITRRPNLMPKVQIEIVPPEPVKDPKPPTIKRPPRKEVANNPPPPPAPPGLPNARPDFFPETQGDHLLALFLAGAYVPDIVLVGVPAGTAGDQVQALADNNDLAILDSLQSDLLGLDFYRLRLLGGQQVHEVVAALDGEPIAVSKSPDFYYGLVGETATASAIQFAPQRMNVVEAHKVAMGHAVKVAIIDTGIDDAHPELNGSVSENFDAVDAAPDAPTRHGTAMAGVIAAKVQLTGIAPEVDILSARAFAPPKDGGSASGTTFAIIKSLDWAYRSGARVYNLSFAGPKDPVLIRALDALTEYHTIMIGAAGNAGPGKPPAYPAAHPGVIAVTATDQNDGLYTMANRGSYVAVAAPGVDIITTTPGDRYELMSGTSIATAHVTGVVALVLERHPDLKAEAVAQLLANASTDLGPAGIDSEFGAGLVDALKALKSSDEIVGLLSGGLTAQ
ncbi:MAG TPA: S8 family serine peptidase [Afifellaceae bacterium]|nr:S8 family serine peptidase [Afifellaceae bacterium]